MDEVILKEKRRKIYDINAVDGKTGYNLGHLLTDNVSLYSFRKFFVSEKRMHYKNAFTHFEEYHEMIFLALPCSIEIE